MNKAKVYYAADLFNRARKAEKKMEKLDEEATAAMLDFTHEETAEYVRLTTPKLTAADCVCGEEGDPDCEYCIQNGLTGSRCPALNGSR